MLIQRYTNKKTVGKNMALIFLLLSLMTAIASIALVVFPEGRLNQCVKKIPWISPVAGIAGFIVFIMFVITTGQLARGETSPIPWEAFSQEYRRHGLVDGLFVFFMMISYLLWALLIPGHLKASSEKLINGKRPIYPYIINLLVGLLLVTPGNPLYRMLINF